MIYKRIYVHPFVIDAIAKTLPAQLRMCVPSLNVKGVQNIIYRDYVYVADDNPKETE